MLPFNGSSNGNTFNIVSLYIKTKVEWKIMLQITKTCESMCQRTCATLSQSSSIQSIASFDHDRYKIKKKK